MSHSGHCLAPGTHSSSNPFLSRHPDFLAYPLIMRLMVSPIIGQYGVCHEYMRAI